VVVLIPESKTKRNRPFVSYTNDDDDDDYSSSDDDRPTVKHNNTHKAVSYVSLTDGKLHCYIFFIQDSIILFSHVTDSDAKPTAKKKKIVTDEAELMFNTYAKECTSHDSDTQHFSTTQAIALHDLNGQEQDKCNKYHLR
jgi:V8-like Glu-specific endopeptidase